MEKKQKFTSNWSKVENITDEIKCLEGFERTLAYFHVAAVLSPLEQTLRLVDNTAKCALILLCVLCLIYSYQLVH